VHIHRDLKFQYALIFAPNTQSRLKFVPYVVSRRKSLLTDGIRHEPENTPCACGCQLQRIGEYVSEKLDYTSGVFAVEQHVRGKCACRHCETLIQAPVPAQVID
jgi:transposase